MKLETSVELLERVRAAHGCSWWALSKVIPASESTVNNWKHGRSAIGREYVTRVAELLEEPAEYVLACVEHEREQDAGARKLWQRIAAKFRSHAASVLLALVLLPGLFLPGSQGVRGAMGGSCFAQTVYYVKSLIRRIRGARRVMCAAT
jgi:hypothetical protein